MLGAVHFLDTGILKLTGIASVLMYRCIYPEWSCSSALRHFRGMNFGNKPRSLCVFVGVLFPRLEMAFQKTVILESVAFCLVNKTFDRDNEPYSDKALNEWESKGTKCITHPNGFADDLASRVWP
ncbi:unnamed protein product [Lepidochelys kempii]